MTTFKQEQRAAHRIAKEHGFWSEERRNVYEKIALMHSELSEALEELRAGKLVYGVYYRNGDRKPEGFGMELADCVIRILDLAEYLGLDIGELVAEKQAFNSTRPMMHGKLA